MLKKIIRKVTGINLIWKLMIPLLFLAIAGNTIVEYIGLKSQQQMIRAQEHGEIRSFFHLFMAKIDYSKRQAISLAMTVAKNPRVQKLLYDGDREELTKFLIPTYESLKREVGISQFHLHTPDAKSFLRLHKLSTYGDSLSYRNTILAAENRRAVVAGVEKGLTGLSIRGVAPVIYKGQLVGTIEIGYPFGVSFLQDLKLKWGPDFTIYERTGENNYQCMFTTLGVCNEWNIIYSLPDTGSDEPKIVIAPPDSPNKSFTIGPINDYSENLVGIVKIEKDRSEIIDKLNKTRNMMVFVGFAGILISSLVVWLVSAQFTKPIKEIVHAAHEIAEERRDVRLEPGPDDEIGKLTQSLNSMLDSLKQRRLAIEDYAKTLERRVNERTAELVSSEEKYRTLVEHLPLIVYRLLEDGTVEFVNPYFEKKLGYSIEEVSKDKDFWWKTIYGKTQHDRMDFQKRFSDDTLDYREERTIIDKEGRALIFIDQMIPMKDASGEVAWVDGIMMDFTELKELQQKAIETEEARVLSEISARFAHEIRNPLSVAGGFARRLRDSLSPEEKSHELAVIIVTEVSRLEQLLRTMLSSLEPIMLCVGEHDVNHILDSVLGRVEEKLTKKGIGIQKSMSPGLPTVKCDSKLLGRALESFVQHALSSSPAGESLFLSTGLENQHIVVILRYKEEGISEDDMEHFFFPRFMDSDECGVEFPLARVLIHRHGGTVTASREEGDLTVIRVRLIAG